jgi:hypothetical protein
LLDWYQSNLPHEQQQQQQSDVESGQPEDTLGGSSKQQEQRQALLPHKRQGSKLKRRTVRAGRCCVLCMYKMYDPLQVLVPRLHVALQSPTGSCVAAVCCLCSFGVLVQGQHAALQLAAVTDMACLSPAI